MRWSIPGSLFARYIHKHIPAPHARACGRLSTLLRGHIPTRSSVPARPDLDLTEILTQPPKARIGCTGHASF